MDGSSSSFLQKSVISAPHECKVDSLESGLLQGLSLSIKSGSVPPFGVDLSKTDDSVFFSDCGMLAYSIAGDDSVHSHVNVLCDHKLPSGDKVWLVTKFLLPLKGNVCSLKFYHKVKSPVVDSLVLKNETTELHLVIMASSTSMPSSFKIFKVNLMDVPFKFLPQRSPDCILPTRAAIEMLWSDSECSEDLSLYEVL